MSGICESYAMFTLPPEVPVKSYGSPRTLFNHHWQSLQVCLFKLDPLLMIANTTLLVIISLSIKKSWQEKMEITFPSRPAREDKRRFLSLESSHDDSLFVSRIANILEGSSEAKADSRWIYLYFVSQFL
jgi:hypothetical protein